MNRDSVELHIGYLFPFILFSFCFIISIETRKRVKESNSLFGSTNLAHKVNFDSESQTNQTAKLKKHPNKPAILMTYRPWVEMTAVDML